MPAHCCCFGCKSRQEKGSQLKFYRIPKEKDLRLRWISAIKRENWLPTDHSRICSKHFIKGRPSRDESDPDFVPSLFSFTPIGKQSTKHVEGKVQRHNRLVKRSENANRVTAARALLLLGESENENESAVSVPGMSTQTDRNTHESATQTDIDKSLLQGILQTNRDLKESLDRTVEENGSTKEAYGKSLEKVLALESQLNNLKEELQDLHDENEVIREEYRNRVLSYQAIRMNEDQLKFYTGLPNIATFQVVFESTVILTNRKKTQLEKEDELLLTLIRLRRNLSVADIGYRFGVSAAHVTRVFHIWLNALYRSLGGLVMWPESDRMELPPVFQNELFRRTRCIIDCTEVFIEKPQVLKARAQTYSNYKRHNTIKFLVGISPSGAVIFLSKCWGGRASDKVITIESGLLDKLIPGDVVLADRGFTMEEEFDFKGAKLIVPAFTKGKRQLSAKEVEDSRLMSRARIHVERVIGRIKDFESLKGVLPITVVKRPSDPVEPTVNKIVTVVSAIVNMNDPLL